VQSFQSDFSLLKTHFTVLSPIFIFFLYYYFFSPPPPNITCHKKATWQLSAALVRGRVQERQQSLTDTD